MFARGATGGVARRQASPNYRSRQPFGRADLGAGLTRARLLRLSSPQVALRVRVFFVPGPSPADKLSYKPQKSAASPSGASPFSFFPFLECPAILWALFSLPDSWIALSGEDRRSCKWQVLTFFGQSTQEVSLNKNPMKNNCGVSINNQAILLKKN